MTKNDIIINARWNKSVLRAEREIDKLKFFVDKEVHHIVISLDVQEKLANYYFENFDKWYGE